MRCLAVNKSIHRLSRSPRCCNLQPRWTIRGPRTDACRSCAACSCVPGERLGRAKDGPCSRWQQIARFSFHARKKVTGLTVPLRSDRAGNMDDRQQSGPIERRSLRRSAFARPGILSASSCGGKSIQRLLFSSAQMNSCPGSCPERLSRHEGAKQGPQPPRLG